MTWSVGDEYVGSVVSHSSLKRAERAREACRKGVGDVVIARYCQDGTAQAPEEAS